MKLMGNISKESRNLSGALSPRSGGGRVKDVTYDGQSVVDENGVAVIPPYPQIPTIPVKDVLYNNQSIITKRCFKKSTTNSSSHTEVQELRKIY